MNSIKNLVTIIYKYALPNGKEDNNLYSLLLLDKNYIYNKNTAKLPLIKDTNTLIKDIALDLVINKLSKTIFYCNNLKDYMEKLKDSCFNYLEEDEYNTICKNENTIREFLTQCDGFQEYNDNENIYIICDISEGIGCYPSSKIEDILYYNLEDYLEYNTDIEITLEECLNKNNTIIKENQSLIDTTQQYLEYYLQLQQMA